MDPLLLFLQPSEESRLWNRPSIPSSAELRHQPTDPAIAALPPPLPDQLCPSLRRTCLHSLVRQYGHPAHLFYQHRLDGLCARMSVGCPAASRGRNWINAVLPLELVAIGLACWTLQAYERGEMSIAAGNQGAAARNLLRAESVNTAPLGRTYPIEVVAGLFYAPHRVDVRGARPGDGPRIQRHSEPSRRVHDECVRKPGRDCGVRLDGRTSGPSASLVRHRPGPLARVRHPVPADPGLALAAILFLVGWLPPPETGREAGDLVALLQGGVPTRDRNHRDQ